MTSLCVIGTSHAVDTSVVCGPYRTAEAATEACRDLAARGFATETCELLDVEDVDYIYLKACGGLGVGAGIYAPVDPELERTRAERDQAMVQAAQLLAGRQTWKGIAFAMEEAKDAAVDELARQSTELALLRRSTAPLRRYCGWPDCRDWYLADLGPVDGLGWARAASILLCPTHAAAGHTPSMTGSGEDPIAAQPTCECGDAGEPVASRGAVVAWWEQHVRTTKGEKQNG